MSSLRGRKIVAPPARERLDTWRRDTRPTLAVERVALLHIDADWYQSALDVREALIDGVVPGGFVDFDDYGYWKGCSEGWATFRERRGVTYPFVDIDGTGTYLRVE